MVPPKGINMDDSDVPDILYRFSDFEIEVFGFVRRFWRV